MVMTTLENTTWEVIFGSRPVFKVNFNDDGTAVVMFPEGSSAKAYWLEESDGKFMFQCARAVENKRSNEAFFGIHEDNEACGAWCEPRTGLHDFRMKKR
jgi:hypothetical protein